MDYALLANYILLWFGFGVFHTVLTFDTIKNVSRLPPQYYRIVYNVLQTIALLFVLSRVPSITQVLMRGLQLEGWQQIGFLLFAFVGGIIATLGLWKWDMLAFIGLKKEENTELRTDGIYTFSRHPVYTGSILLFIATLFVEVSEGTLSWVLGAGGYFMIGSLFEEIKLAKAFENYNAYKKSVAWIFPWKPSHFKNFFRNIPSLL